MSDSTTVPPNTPPPSPPPTGPTHPAPTHPPTRYADAAIFTAVDQLLVDLARPSKPSPPSRPPKKPINTKPIRLESPARRDSVGVLSPAGSGKNGAPGGEVGGPPASGFSLPLRPPVPRFTEGEDRLVGAVRMGGPSDGGETGPKPPPPPLRHPFPLVTGP